MKYSDNNCNSHSLSNSNLPRRRTNLLKLKVLSHPEINEQKSSSLPYKINPRAVEYSKWISKWHTDNCYSMTLTFRRKIFTDATAVRYLRNLNVALRKSIYPKSALSSDKLNAGKHLSIFAVLEDCRDGGIHIHAIIFEPPYDPKEVNPANLVIDTWQKITKSSNNKLEKLETIAEMRKYLEYSMKLQRLDSDRVHFFCWDSRKG